MLFELSTPSQAPSPSAEPNNAPLGLHPSAGWRSGQTESWRSLPLGVASCKMPIAAASGRESKSTTPRSAMIPLSLALAGVRNGRTQQASLLAFGLWFDADWSVSDAVSRPLREMSYPGAAQIVVDSPWLWLWTHLLTRPKTQTWCLRFGFGDQRSAVGLHLGVPICG